MTNKEAKDSLNKIIDKARVHLYKPIQIAEILHRDRINKDVDLNNVESYRTKSRAWRDIVCLQFLGRTSTSSARYQDDVFNENAVPPEAIRTLAQINKANNGIVEEYIYSKFKQRFSQLSTGLDYCISHDRKNFMLVEFLEMFWLEPGLRRSIDKIYEIVVYSIFSSIIEIIDLKIDAYIDENKLVVLNEFYGFAKKILGFSENQTRLTISGKINRVGVTNAADRGLDMWSNFGLTIQVKHLSLTEELAESIVSAVSSDRIILICKSSEESVLISVLNQIGWKSKIQSIVTESELISWYETALRGKYSNLIADRLLQKIKNEIQVEFPTTDNTEFNTFLELRKYRTNVSDF
ncbi:type II restriction enzyme [Lampropedia hyalina DSM 16112]|jgi:type II restriction enzyme|uniref:Type II restriction enzyme n=1 Tax=Lampropedia hyalina DSM 16112 TaxID=1122156 RepID=A0A1M5E5C6_9BURK|nr:HaeII family restriction endonuclease [Lampropedia hyalina]SHF74458.1 type II restriction enzyme [Lampropedia hyalina DSM 16112]